MRHYISRRDPPVPVWTATPSPSFTQGIAANYPLSGVSSDPQGGTLTYTSIGAALPTGVTIVGTNLAYDGIGSPTTVAALQIRATSSAGSSNSALFSLTIAAGALALAQPPAQSATQGVAYSYDFSQHRTGGVAPFTWSVTSGALPTGISLNASTGVASGTPSASGSFSPVIQVADAAGGSSWATRSTTGRVLFATDFSSVANDFNQTTRVFGQNDGSPGAAYWKSLVSQETGQARVGTALRIDSPASTGANGAGWYCSLNPGGFPGSSALGGGWTLNSQGMGTTGFYVSFRQWIPVSRLTVRSSNGFKYWDLSAYSPVDPANQSYSNTLFECIGENTNWKGKITAYHRDQTGSFPAFGQQFDALVGDIRITDQDNGTGANADRYCLYNGGSYSAGCFPLIAGEWITYKIYVQAQTYGGSTGNIFRLWAARQDATSWTQIYDQSNFGLGTDARFTGGFCGLWLNAYETSYVNTGTPDTHQLWSQLIVSLDDIALPEVGQ